ncbi:MAG TPA: hypothetical protein DD730_14080 [Desulfosporosinus sp.]|jgi:hypothetical protein|nr:hypothetical protein [Desulfosporosinus sp.]
MEEGKEKAIIELLRQKKPYSEIEQQLHISSRDISQTKKKYGEEQNKIQSQSELQSEVVPSDLHVSEQHEDQKCEPNTEQDGIYEALTNINKELIEEKHELTDIIFSQREEIQVLKDELKRACIKRRSGIIAMKTEWLYDEARFLLNRDVEYCYLIYEYTKKRLVDALQYEDDLTKEIERAKEQPIQETNNKLQLQSDGSIF